MSKEIKQNKFTCYKGKAALVIDNWLDNGKVLMKIAPALPDKPAGQPQANSHCYNWEKAITIGFSYQDMLKCSFKLTQMAFGDDSVKYEKYADLSKVAEKELTGNKKLSIYPSSYKGKNGDVFIVSVNLSLDKENISIALDYDETYTLAKHFEMVYNYALQNTLTKSLEFEKKED